MPYSKCTQLDNTRQTMETPRLNASQESGPGLPESFFGCRELLATALVLEADLEKAEAAASANEEAYYEAQREAINDDPEAQAARRQREAAEEAYSAASSIPGATNLKELRRRRRIASDGQSSTYRAVVHKSDEVHQTLEILEKSRALAYGLNTRFEHARKTALQALAPFCGRRPSWAALKQRLGPQCLQRLLESRRQLEEAQENHRQNVNEIPILLSSFRSLPSSGRRNRGRPRKGNKQSAGQRS